MKHRVYMRDWYFNAGIAGFLRVISNDAMPDKIEKIDGLEIGENFIEFDNKTLENFRIKFLKYAFMLFMNLDIYKNKFRTLIKQFDNDKEKKLTIKKITNEFKTSYDKFNKIILKIDFEKIETLSKIHTTLQEALKKTEKISIENLFNELIKTKEGEDYLEWFLEGWKLKGILSTKHFDKYIKQIENTNEKKSLKNNDLCLSCQKNKSEFEFNNSISNIIGFNKDNSNWVWGYKSSKLKFCGLCSIIYSSALLATVWINKYINDNRVDCYYFLNRNSNIKSLYQSIQLFQKNILLENKELSFAQIIKNTITNILKKQTQSIIENINFIEIIENPILAGQSSKGYNIYNYNLTVNIANFLKEKLSSEKALPTGYYKIKDGSYSVMDELISKTIQYKLGYSELNRFYDYYIREGIKSFYNIFKVSNYIFDYINIIGNGGSKMLENKKVIDKAFFNGKDLRKVIVEEKKRENQINGIVYALLNDLKITNREGFLDKYIRLMMSNGLESKFGSNNEMSDSDKFLQFGYSFINGLLNKPYEDKKDTNQDKGE